MSSNSNDTSQLEDEDPNYWIYLSVTGEDDLEYMIRSTRLGQL